MLSWQLLQTDAVVLLRWAKKWFLGCLNFLPFSAWLLLCKTGPPFSLSLYREWLNIFSVLLSITHAAPGRNTRNLGKGT